MSDLEIPIIRPKKVTRALLLMWAAFIFGMIYFVVSGIVSDYPLSYMVLSFGFAIVFGPILLFKIGLGKKWARTIYVIIVCLGILIGAVALPDFLVSNPVGGVISILSHILQIIVLFLLFSKESNEWYNLKNQTISLPSEE